MAETIRTIAIQPAFASKNLIKWDYGTAGPGDDGTTGRGGDGAGKELARTAVRGYEGGGACGCFNCFAQALGRETRFGAQERNGQKGVILHKQKREHDGEHKVQSAKAVMTRLLYWQLRRKAFLAKWSTVDWSKQDVELADEMGLSRERIRQIRQKVGAPKSARQHKMRKSAAALQWAKDNLDKFKGLSGAELGRKYGLGPHWQHGPLYPFLKPLLRDGKRIRKHRWDLMNFRLPNHDLERIWRLPRNMVAAYRFRNQRPPPAWCFKRVRGHTQLSGREQLPAYRRTVKAEERNAARYFAQARVALKPGPSQGKAAADRGRQT